MEHKAEIHRQEGTRVEQVVSLIQQRISSRSLAPGARLPSIRSLAGTLGFSNSTVVEAYDRLSAEGVILSRRGSGFYVAGHLPPLSLADLAPRLDRAVDPLWVSRQSLEADEGFLKPGCGWMPPGWMPEASIRKALRTISRGDESLLVDYATPLGSLPLRGLLAQRLINSGLDVVPDQILLTDSGTQAIDLLCRFLIEPGATVLVDDPCYFNFHAILRAHRARVVSVPFTPAGPDPDAFAQVLKEERPRLYITNTALQNPTGATLSPVIAHKILKLIEDSGMIVVEDDTFADFEHETAPRLAAFDGLERVIHIGSFSKRLSASVRCGYIVARPDWVEGLVDLKIATTFGAGNLSAGLIHTVLKDGSYRRHMESLRTRLARSMGETRQRLGAVGIRPWIMPKGGMYLWCQLPDGADAADLARKALSENIVLAPGNVFSQSSSASGFLRFNVTQSSDPRIYEVLKRLMA
ncbi:aminotransferase-like domain-containing protein [Kiloniella sp. b19]|uniref:aminotransferase-like domain-containing protein n=1 Tax=Kiloniella sp. GXU_MW_B19 TaxID=3141326 RepID=UPI0031D90F48